MNKFHVEHSVDFYPLSPIPYSLFPIPSLHLALTPTFRNDFFSAFRI
jgi:hypothetical protein